MGPEWVCVVEMAQEFGLSTIWDMHSMTPWIQILREEKGIDVEKYRGKIRTRRWPVIGSFDLVPVCYDASLCFLFFGFIKFSMSKPSNFYAWLKLTLLVEINILK